MRRAPVLGAAGLVLAVGVIALVAVLSGRSPAQLGTVHITRLYIPLIKAACTEEVLGVTGLSIGYRFTPDNALTTIDVDGSLTGIAPADLARLNACLARYPIEPAREIPQDHYTRNLLYDYDAAVLKPCLEHALDEQLAPLPRRADFVERLYGWNPYPALAHRLTLSELLALDAQCPPIPPYLEQD
jgi:hypothetical protein